MSHGWQFWISVGAVQHSSWELGGLAAAVHFLPRRRRWDVVDPRETSDRCHDGARHQSTDGSEPSEEASGKINGISSL